MKRALLIAATMLACLPATACAHLLPPSVTPGLLSPNVYDRAAVVFKLRMDGPCGNGIAWRCNRASETTQCAGHTRHRIFCTGGYWEHHIPPFPGSRYCLASGEVYHDGRVFNYKDSCHG